jgi:hypothetical protein
MQVSGKGFKKGRPGHGSWQILGTQRPADGEPWIWYRVTLADSRLGALCLGGHLVYRGDLYAIAVVNLRTRMLDSVWPMVPFPGKVRFGSVDINSFGELEVNSVFGKEGK